MLMGMNEGNRGKQHKNSKTSRTADPWPPHKPQLVERFENRSQGEKEEGWQWLAGLRSDWSREFKMKTHRFFQGEWLGETSCCNTSSCMDNDSHMLCVSGDAQYGFRGFIKLI